MSAPVDAIAPLDFPQASGMQTDTASSSPVRSFSDALANSVDQVDQQVTQADLEVRKLAVGEGGDLHRVMIALEDARMSLSLMVQVRNRVVEAYQDLMRMQI